MKTNINSNKTLEILNFGEFILQMNAKDREKLFLRLHEQAFQLCANFRDVEGNQNRNIEGDYKSIYGKIAENLKETSKKMELLYELVRDQGSIKINDNIFLKFDEVINQCKKNQQSHKYINDSISQNDDLKIQLHLVETKMAEFVNDLNFESNMGVDSRSTDSRREWLKSNDFNLQITKSISETLEFCQKLRNINKRSKKISEWEEIIDNFFTDSDGERSEIANFEKEANSQKLNIYTNAHKLDHKLRYFLENSAFLSPNQIHQLKARRNILQLTLEETNDKKSELKTSEQEEKVQKQNRVPIFKKAFSKIGNFFGLGNKAA